VKRKGDPNEYPSLRVILELEAMLAIVELFEP
jgi:hypothetical protein